MENKLKCPSSFTKATSSKAKLPFLRTVKALIDLYEEKLTLRVGNEPFSGSTTNHSDALPPSFSPVKTSDNLEEFADELTLLKKGVQKENFQVYSNPLFEFDYDFNSSNENPLFNEKDEDVKNKNSNISNSDEPVLLNTPLTDKVECFDPEDEVDEIDTFLAMEVSSNFEEGYFDSEGEVIFLENLLSDDTTHNLAPEMISDHEPEQNESSITFSPWSDPLHHEFAGELIALPLRIAREHEEYLSRMTLLCEISTSRSQENVHANPSSIIESLPVSLIPVEDSDPVQEEIDIFLVPDDLIPPGVENDDFEDEDNSTLLLEHESHNLDHQDNPSSPRPPPEPPDVKIRLEPDTAMNDEDFNQGEIVLSLNVEDVNSFTFVIWTFLLFFTYSEDSPVNLSLRSPSNTKENRIMDLKLEYQTFRAKPFKSLLQTYTRYKTMLNELTNDGVTLSKHEINMGFVNSLPEKWLSFSQGLRNANHTKTLDLADIYGDSPISIAFFSNSIVQDFQENSDDEADKRSIEEYLRDLELEFHKRALLANSKFQKDYKAEYKKMKAKLALLEASPSTSQSPKLFQSKNKGLVAETFDWDEEEVVDDEEMTQVNVLMALAADELYVGKNHARNGEWIDITMKKVNILLSMDEDSDWQTYLKYINIDLKYVKEQRLNLLSKHNKIIFELNKCRDVLALKQAKLEAGASPSSEVMTLNYQDHSPRERPGLGVMKHTNLETQESLSKNVSKTVTVCDTEPITSLVPAEVKINDQESKIDELAKLVQMLMDEKINSTQKIQESKYDHKTLDHDIYVASLKSSKNYKARPYQYASPSKQILKSKAKPYPPCTHCGFNDHHPDDYRNYPECEICRSYDHFTSGYNHVIHVNEGVLAESSQSNESSIGVSCTTCGSKVHSATDHNEFEHFKRGDKIQATKVGEPTKKWVHKQN
ncbi:hypothetical protein Tco_0894177 [Tanacetum coccineum]|uniref:Retrovirus-related Pol polyprotein from transposon TNT 1-94 n=1 Tax=Tanacetum coccineum TaxID=301880 RepID=A0ABQ5CB29_9ASTR